MNSRNTEFLTMVIQSNLLWSLSNSVGSSAAIGSDMREGLLIPLELTALTLK